MVSRCNRFLMSVVGWGLLACLSTLVVADPAPQSGPGPRQRPRTGVDIWDDEVPPPRPSPRPMPVPTEHEVAPLEEWVPTDDMPELEQNPSSTPPPSPTAVRHAEDEKLEDESPVSQWAPPPPPKYGTLAIKGGISSSQIKRLKQVEKFQRAVVSADRRKLRSMFPADPRGESELTVCSADLNGYSVLTDFKRLFRGKGQKQRRALERSLVEALTAARCDVVAVQAVYGATFARATEALTKLAEELEKKLGVAWKVEMEEIPSQQAWSGFLIRDGGFTVQDVKTYEEYPIPSLELKGGKGGLVPNRFSRAPIVLTLRVPGKNSAQARDVSIVNFDLRRSLVAKTAEAQDGLMRFAEAVRAVVEEMLTRRPAEDGPIIVVAGQRGSGGTSPAALILEGSLHFRSFAEGNGCMLDAKERIRCETDAEAGRSLFTVLPRPHAVKKPTPKPKEPEEGEEAVTEEAAAEPEAAPEAVSTAEGEGGVESASEEGVSAEGDDAARATPTPLPPNPRAKWLPPKSEMTTDLLLPPADLNTAYLEAGRTGRFASGKVPFKNGLADGVLVWVTLNWR